MAKIDDTMEESAPGRKPKASQKSVQPDADARGTTQPENSIQFVFDEPVASGGPTKRGSKNRAKPENAVALTNAKAAESLASRIPDSVYERFINVGNNFYFPDGTEAFTREKYRLTTRSENAIVIQSMVAIAREESQKGIVKLTGTDFFRKEAWFAASLAGLKVEGYEPTEFERERLVRALGRRATPLQEATSEARPDRSREDHAGIAKPAERSSKAPQESELIVGRLVDHGAAPYNHNPKEQPSYFVRLETARGDREIWGADLERAFRQSLSTPGIGDDVGIRAVGKQPVTIPARREADGQEVREELKTHRNQWSVERKDFLDRRREMADVFRDLSVTAAEGIRRYSGLEGSYLELQMGQALVNEQYGSKLHRQQFVEHLREHLARGIEYGKPLEPVRLRVKEERTPESRAQNRDYNPTR